MQARGSRPGNGPEEEEGPSRQLRNGRVLEPFPVDRCLHWNPLPDSYHLLAELLRSPLDEYKLVIAQHALVQIEAHITPVAEQPRVGLLLGQVSEDPDSGMKYVIIRAAIKVPDEGIGADGENLSDESWVTIEREMRRQTRQVVGWYRTRQRIESAMSPADSLGHVGHFRHPWQSALMVSADLARPAGAFFVFERRVGRHYCLPFYEMLDSAPSRRSLDPHSVINWRNYLLETDAPEPPELALPSLPKRKRPDAARPARSGPGPVLLDLQQSVRTMVGQASERARAWPGVFPPAPESHAAPDLSSPLTVLLPSGFYDNAQRRKARSVAAVSVAALLVLVSAIALVSRGSTASASDTPHVLTDAGTEAVHAAANQPTGRSEPATIVPPRRSERVSPASRTLAQPAATPEAAVPSASRPAVTDASASDAAAADAGATDEDATRSVRATGGDALAVFVGHADEMRAALRTYRARVLAYARAPEPADCEPVRAAYRDASGAYVLLTTAQRAVSPRLTLDHSMRYNKLAADVGEMDREFRRSPCRIR